MHEERAWFVMPSAIRALRLPRSWLKEQNTGQQCGW